LIVSATKFNISARQVMCIIFGWNTFKCLPHFNMYAAPSITNSLNFPAIMVVFHRISNKIYIYTCLHIYFYHSFIYQVIYLQI
ncbi:unnamed protein product, partial [Tenebrio molitor]